jgi:DivIVA domain-containing protein
MRERAPGARVGHTRIVTGNEPPRTDHSEAEVVFGGPRSGESLGDVRDPLPPEIRDPSFSTSVRGYDRRAVDAYVQRVNRLIAELQVGGSPRAAVRHALERVGEQTSGILQRARETAEEITTNARQEAEETTARAKAEAQDILTRAQREASEATSHARAEADEIVVSARATADENLARAKEESESAVAGARVDAEGRIRRAEEEIASLREQAEARLRSLQADIGTISDQRRTLLEDAHRIAARLAEIVAEAEPRDEETPLETTPTPEPAATAAMPAASREGEAHDERPAEARQGREG